MSLHKSGAQKRRQKKKCADNERRGLQALFQVGMRQPHNVKIYTKEAHFEDGRVLVAVVEKGIDVEIRWKLIEKQLPGLVKIS